MVNRADKPSPTAQISIAGNIDNSILVIGNDARINHVTTPARRPSAHEKSGPPATQGPVPDQAALRRLVGKILVSDSDLTAFISDHFPEVRARMSNSMVRTDKVTLLLEHAEHEQIHRYLVDNYPREVAHYSRP